MPDSLMGRGPRLLAMSSELEGASGPVGCHLDVLLDPVALDFGTLVMIGVVLDRSTPESFASFEKAVQKVSGCLECHVVTGEFDYFMLVRTRDNDSYNRLHAEQLLYLPGVRQIRTFMVLKEVMSTTQLPLQA